MLSWCAELPSVELPAVPHAQGGGLLSVSSLHHPVPTHRHQISVSPRCCIIQFLHTGIKFQFLHNSTRTPASNFNFSTTAQGPHGPHTSCDLHASVAEFELQLAYEGIYLIVEGVVNSSLQSVWSWVPRNSWKFGSCPFILGDKCRGKLQPRTLAG